MPVKLRMHSCAVQLAEDAFTTSASLLPSAIEQTGSSNWAQGSGRSSAACLPGSKGSDILIQGTFLGLSELTCMQIANDVRETLDAFAALPGLRVEQTAASPEEALGGWGTGFGVGNTGGGSSSTGSASSVASSRGSTGQGFSGDEGVWVEAAVEFLFRSVERDEEYIAVIAAEEGASIREAAQYIADEAMWASRAGVVQGLTEQQQQVVMGRVLAQLGYGPEEQQQEEEEEEEKQEVGEGLAQGQAACQGASAPGRTGVGAATTPPPGFSPFSMIRSVMARLGFGLGRDVEGLGLAARQEAGATAGTGRQVAPADAGPSSPAAAAGSGSGRALTGSTGAGSAATGAAAGVSGSGSSSSAAGAAARWVWSLRTALGPWA